MRRSRLSNSAAGLLTIGAVLTAVYLAFIDVPFSGGSEYRAVFASANEVGSRSPVRIAGVQVGEVTGVERGPGGTAIVTMEIDDKGLPLHRDAEVKVRPRIFLEGNFFLDLEPGTPGGPELEEGGTIPLAQTATPVQLDQVLSTLQTGTRENLKELVEQYRAALDEGGAQAFGDAAEPSAGAFAGSAQVAEATRGREDGDLAGLVEDGGRVAAAASRDDERLAELVTGLNRTVRGLAAGQDNLARAVSELDGVVEQAGPALEAVNELVPPARRFVADVRPGIQAAPPTLRAAVPLLDQVAGLLRADELPELRRELDPAVRSLASLTPDLVDLFELVTPVTECLRRNAVPTLKTPLEDPPNSTRQPVYRDLLYGLVGLAGASRSFDGNGPAVRYHAGFGDATVTTARVPGTNELLFGLTDEPLLGSRPRYTGQLPPFRTDVPCVSQEPPDLRAETGPAPTQIPASSLREGGE